METLVGTMEAVPSPVTGVLVTVIVGETVDVGEIVDVFVMVCVTVTVGDGSITAIVGCGVIG